MIGILTNDINNLYRTLRCVVFGNVGRIKFPTTEGFIIKIKGEEVLVSNIGCQKVEMSKNIAEINSEYPMSAILYAENGASLDSSNLKIGDIAIAESALQYDIDFTSLGYSSGYMDLLKKDLLFADDVLKQKAEAAVSNLNFGFKYGKAISADKFISSTENSLKLKDIFKADFIDTGSSPVYEVSNFYNIPAVSLIGISNYADDNAKNDYLDNKDKVTINALECAITLAKELL